MKQIIRLISNEEDQIEVTVIIVVGPGSRGASTEDLRDRASGNAAERAVAVVVVEKLEG